MAMTVVLILILGGAFGFWWLRRNRGNAPSAAVALEPVAASKEAPRRPGRMINPCEEHCAAAKKIATAWYAEGEAPRLPLESCEHPETCRCTWMRVLDRRSTHRRTGHDRRDSLRFEEEKSDRRTGEDRRDKRANAWKNAG